MAKLRRKMMVGVIGFKQLKNKLRIFSVSGLILFSLLISPITQATTIAQGVPIMGSPSTMPTRFDQHFVTLMRAWHIPGATVAVMKHGKLLMVRGYGWSDISSHQMMQPDALFRIASVSKTFT